MAPLLRSLYFCSSPFCVFFFLEFRNNCEGLPLTMHLCSLNSCSEMWAVTQKWERKPGSKHWELSLYTQEKTLNQEARENVFTVFVCYWGTLQFTCVCHGSFHLITLALIYFGFICIQVFQPRRESSAFPSHMQYMSHMPYTSSTYMV